MPKIRIYELAKQLKVDSKVIMQILNESGKEGSSHFASLEDSEITLIKNKINKPEQSTAEQKPAKKERQEAETINEKQQSGKKWKKRKSDGERPPKSDRENSTRTEAEQLHRKKNRADGENPPKPDGEQPNEPLKKRRPEGERPPRLDGERPPRPEGERPGELRKKRRPEGERPPRPEGERPGELRKKRRPEGERPPRPEGERPGELRKKRRPEGERPPRPEGERPGELRKKRRPEGERPPRPEGEQLGEPRKKRRPEGERPPRPEGEQLGELRKRRKLDDERPPRLDGDDSSKAKIRRKREIDGEHPPIQEDEPRKKRRLDGEPTVIRPRGDGENRAIRTDRENQVLRPRQETDKAMQVGNIIIRPYGEARPRHTASTPPAKPSTERVLRPRDRPIGERGDRPKRPEAERPRKTKPTGEQPRKFDMERPRKGDQRRRDADKSAPFKETPIKAEPTKSDRKQEWQKRTDAVKAKGKKESLKDNFQPRYFQQKKGFRRDDRGHSERRGVKKQKRIMPETVIPTVTQITVGPDVTVREMAEKLYKSIADIIKLLMKRGVMVTANQVIDFDTAFYIGECFDCLVEEYVEQDVFEVAFDEQEEDESLLETRPPVVVVMGHVDHGKTSLLDVIRNTSVTAGEAGGITQHIGAYTVEINGKPITFLDTPGHEAFTAMRMRGAQVTDIAVLVVAANDGVMPQTIEAINHAKAAEVEIIVAINKIDLPDANPDRVKQELTEHDLLVEDWGGSIISVPVSAKQKTGISDLLEMIILASEVKELKANPNKRARGHVIEAKLDKGRGAVATVLVESGTLKEGDTVVTGSSFGHIRSMIDDKGTKVKAAGPAIPVEIVGLSEVPNAGDMFFVAESDKQARQLAESVIARGRVSLIKATPNKISLDDLFQQIQQGTVKDLNVVVKADVGGSVEALKTSLEKLSNEQVRVRTIHGGVGAITESDVMLASASNAIIIGFNVRPDNQARMVAESEKVDLRMYRVIYAAIEDIEKAMKGMLAPVYQEKITGHAEIRQLFKASGVGTIAGCHVQDGKILRNNPVRIIRNGIVVYEGTLDTLRRFKDDVREVASGYECGMVFNRFNDIKESDTIESYFMEEIAV